MNLEVTGKIIKILPIQKGTSKEGKEWQKQIFLVDNNAEYNSLFAFEVFGVEKVEKFNQYNKENDMVKVLFNVNTNEWQGKYFTSLSAWRVEKQDTEQRANEAVNDLTEQPDDLPW